MQDQSPVDQITLDMFTAESLEKHTRRFIAGVLGDRESFTGDKDKRSAQIVKDTANYSKRVILTKLTGLEVESVYSDPGKRIPTEKPNEVDVGSS